MQRGWQREGCGTDGEVSTMGPRGRAARAGEHRGQRGAHRAPGRWGGSLKAVGGRAAVGNRSPKGAVPSAGLGGGKRRVLKGPKAVAPAGQCSAKHRHHGPIPAQLALEAANAGRASGPPLQPCVPPTHRD